MFQNVCHTGGIRWNRFEGDAKRVFFIAVADVNVSGAGMRVLEKIKKGINFFEGDNFCDGIA